MSAWLLPDHIADVLPSEARRIEELRRQLLDTARSYGYELVMPPLLEYLDSLLSGTGEELNLQTFKLTDHISGRVMGLRADMTQQVARIDAHLLNREGITRLCYCAPVLHTHPERPRATREPLQFGAEIYGHQGIEADLEALHLALDCVKGAGVKDDVRIDLADVRIVRHLCAGVMVDPRVLLRVHSALAAKDATALENLTKNFPPASRKGLMALLQLYGGAEILEEAKQALSATPAVLPVLHHLERFAKEFADGFAVSFDLADLRGYSYYSGTRFALYAPGAGDALVRGGRYDEVGAAFGRNRPAAGFSLDIKQLVGVTVPQPLKAAIRAPWPDSDSDSDSDSAPESAQLQETVDMLRRQGETVVCSLPQSQHRVDEFHCDRELVLSQSGQWIVVQAAVAQRT